MPSYAAAAIKLFGLTTDPRKAGFILADGRMLDFTTGNGEEDRSRDHREVAKVLRDDALSGIAFDDMVHFMFVTGACRFMPEVVGFEFVTKPTIPQLQQMQLCIELLSEGYEVAVLEMSMVRTGEKLRHFYKEYTTKNIRRLHADVKAFWGQP